MNSSAPTDDRPDPQLTPRFEQALTYANGLHRLQPRKGTLIPYMAHLLAVTAIVLEHGGDEDEAIAALLHDSAEDQDVPIEELRLRFGDRVAEIVKSCSDGLDGERDEGNWRERKKKYLEHLKVAAPSVLLVSAADKLHNLRATVADYRRLGEDFWAPFNSTREDNLWFYRTFVETLTEVGDARLANELSDFVREFEALAATGR